MNRNNEPQGSYIRWQVIRLTQLGYALNLVLSFTIAILGFQMHLLLDQHDFLGCWEKILFVLSQGLLLVSGIFGILCVLNRLADFRTTGDAAKAREHGDPNHELDELRARYTKLGKRTWLFFGWQVACFSLGVMFTIVVDLLTSKIMF